MNHFPTISLILLAASAITAAFISSKDKDNSIHANGRLIASNTNPGAPLTCVADAMASHCHYTRTSISGTTNGDPGTDENIPETTDNTTLPE